MILEGVLKTQVILASLDLTVKYGSGQNLYSNIEIHRKEVAFGFDEFSSPKVQGYYNLIGLRVGTISTTVPLGGRIRILSAVKRNSLFFQDIVLVICKSHCMRPIGVHFFDSSMIG